MDPTLDPTMDPYLELPPRKLGRPRIHERPGTMRRKGHAAAVTQTSVSLRLKLNKNHAELLENADYYGISYGMYIQIIFLKYIENVPYWDADKNLIYRPKANTLDENPFIFSIGMHYALYDELTRRVEALNTQRAFIIRDAMDQYIENGAWGADESEYLNYSISELIYNQVPDHKKTTIQVSIPTEIFLQLEDEAVKLKESFGRHVSTVLTNHILRQGGYELAGEKPRQQKHRRAKLHEYFESANPQQNACQVIP